MKIEKLIIEGIKSHRNTEFTLENYNTIVGENNSGKSNILFAIRWFFKDGNVKIQKEDVNYDYRDDPRLILEFVFEPGEKIPAIFDENYAVDGNRFYIKAYCDYEDVKTKPQFPKHELIKEGLEAKKLATAKVTSLVDLIYVPSIRELSDEIKFTANSTINKLVSKYVIERIESDDAKSGKYRKVEDSINELSDFISSGENSAFENLKKSISNYMLDYGNVEINFQLEPPTVSELIKNSFEASVKISGKKLPLDSQGMGFQRSLIFSLICNMANLEPNSSDTHNLYLIEEPELFLHPNHQNHFKNKLIKLSSQNNQVILISHSPYFLNNIENYSQLKRVSLVSNISNLKEISHDKVKDICDQNGKLMAEAFNHDGRWNERELQREANKIAEEDELRYLLWIDPDRANAFLSKKVILVEGSTEKALFSFIFDNPNDDNKRKSEIMVVDINGKYHFYKFANLLHNLGITTWILHDGDKNRVHSGIDHRKLNEYIAKLKVDDIIVDFKRVDPDIEGFLGIDKDKHKPDISIYQKLVINDCDCRNSENYNEIIDFIRNIVNY